MKNLLKTLSAACLAVGLVSCAQTQKLATNIDTNIECRDICNRYATCYDPQYTVKACTDDCQAKAKTDGDFRRSADACNECMTGNACVETTAACGSECRPVVPLPPATSSR
jgi:hypothetical protein